MLAINVVYFTRPRNKLDSTSFTMKCCVRAFLHDSIVRLWVSIVDTYLVRQIDQQHTRTKVNNIDGENKLYSITTNCRCMYVCMYADQSAIIVTIVTSFKLNITCDYNLQTHSFPYFSKINRITKHTSHMRLTLG